MTEKKKIYTIGHSTHPADEFTRLLETHNINTVCDVRSSPYSAYNPQYNRELLRKSLETNGYEYMYLGDKLGPRSDDPDCYVDDKVSYEKLALTNIFKKGIDEVKELASKKNIVLMCSEKDPVACHRMILISRHLKNDCDIFHILDDGSLEKNADAEKRLLRLLKMPEQSLFDSYDDIIIRAYDVQGRKIAYKIKDDE